MVDLEADRFFKLATILQDYRAAGCPDMMGGHVPDNQNLPDRSRDFTVAMINEVLAHGERLGLRAGIHRALKAKSVILLRKPTNAGVARREITETRNALEGDLLQLKFAFFGQEECELIDRMPEQWVEVFAKFPSAKKDVTSAINCFAVGSYNACVFQLMAVAEIGLRALCQERRVTLKHKGKFKPLNEGTWSDLLTALDNKIKLLNAAKRGKSRLKALAFYGGAKSELEGFKDAFRNDVSHARANYSPNQTKDVMHYVRCFMQRLAQYLDETQTKQIAWSKV